MIRLAIVFFVLTAKVKTTSISLNSIQLGDTVVNM